MAAESRRNLRRIGVAKRSLRAHLSAKGEITLMTSSRADHLICDAIKASVTHCGHCARHPRESNHRAPNRRHGSLLRRVRYRRQIKLLRPPFGAATEANQATGSSRSAPGDLYKNQASSCGDADIAIARQSRSAGTARPGRESSAAVRGIQRQQRLLTACRADDHSQPNQHQSPRPRERVGMLAAL